MRTFTPATASPALALALALILGSTCGAGDPAPAGTSPTGKAPAGGFRLTYRLSGGIAGFDVTFTVEGSGRARYERVRPRPEVHDASLGKPEVEALEQLVRSSGFVDLADRYEAKHGVADGFTYSIRWEAAGLTKEVTASDGAPMPDAFVRVREAVGALERKVVSAAGAKGEGT